MSKRRIGNLKGIDIVEGDINIVNDSEVHISKLFGLYAKDYDFCWLVMPIYHNELRSSKPKTRSSLPEPGDLSFIIVDLLKEQYVFSSIPKDIKTLPIEFEDGHVKFNITRMYEYGYIYSNKEITLVEEDGYHSYIGNCAPLMVINGDIIVDNKTIKFG